MTQTGPQCRWATPAWQKRAEFSRARCASQNGSARWNLIYVTKGIFVAVSTARSVGIHREPTLRTTWVARAPDLSWWPSIYFRKHGVESTQAAETSVHGNLRHRKVGLVEKPLGSLNAGGLSDLHRAGAQMSLE